MALKTARDTERIHADPAIVAGKPVVRGTRIPVALVLDHLSGTLDFDDLFAAYPHLTIEDVRAVFAFARDSVDADYRHSRRQAATEPGNA